MEKKPGSIALAILAKGKKGPPEADPMDDPGAGDDEVGLESAADALIKAVHARDAQMLVDAFKDMFDQLEAAPHDEAEPAEGPAQQ